MTTWTISTMERYNGGDNDGGVIVAHWQAMEVDGDYSARAYSTCSFTPDASSPDYVPYADLTEATVLAWCFADRDVDKDAIEASLTAQIEEQKNPTTEDGVPW